MRMFRTAETRNMIAGLLLAVGASWPAMAAELYVPTTNYPTIQAAVNAAQTNDTIHIAPGVYTGQVLITNKVLTLIGQPGTLLRATTTIPPRPDTFNFPLIFIKFSQVTVRGLTFEGERLAGRFVGDGALLGMLVRESSANVENCAFYGFRETTPGHEYAKAIQADQDLFGNLDTNAVTMRVVRCTFADNYRGVDLAGLPDRQTMNATIENNTIIGPGPVENSDVDQQGIYISEGVGGRIAGNTIRGYSYIGTNAAFPISFGILGANLANSPEFGVLQPLIIEGNTLRDNQEHITLVKANGSIVRNNRIQGTAPGILPLGLHLSGTNVMIANNQFENMPEGIRLLGDDPMYGTLLGLTIGAQVTSNRFCNVTTPINVEPLANATETGTLVCPFPDPALAIATAVMLSWPNYADGWTLESAPDPQGPWSPLDVAPSVQDGQYVFVVKTAAQQAFFRLRQP